MPRLHPREPLVSEASTKLRQRIGEWIDQDAADLTTAELLKCLLGATNDEAQSVLKYEIRFERHGDTDKEGGWA